MSLCRTLQCDYKIEYSTEVFFKIIITALKLFLGIKNC